VLAESCPQLVQAAALAQRIIDGLKEPFLIDEHQLFINTSIGISLFPSDALSAEQLLRNADSALFKAKSAGRNGYALYTEELTAHAQQRVELAFELRRALEQQQLRVYYQPVHDMPTSRMIGVEALVRWEHPERGLVSPAEFIPLPSAPADCRNRRLGDAAGLSANVPVATGWRGLVVRRGECLIAPVRPP
jgi:predicted signal transduction protein with EAL and GGDEF domain